MVREIKLYGKLGATFGRLHRFDVASAAEAMRALCVMVPGFEHALLNSQSQGVGYAVFLGKTNLSGETLHFPAGQEPIRIAPIITGSKRGGLFQVLIGAALIAASFFVPPAGVLGFSALSAGAVFSMGAAMALGGIVQLMSPQPKGLGTADRPENGASYNFNGPVNTTAQGNPVPLLYGEMIIGGAVVSSGIFSQDQ